jgi:hypothetical protein
METKHLQSMIAINANRITEKHARIAAVLTETRQFKAALPTVSPMFLEHVQAMLKKAYSIVDKSRVELKKAVEMQKALQAELRANRAAEKPVKPTYKSYFFVHTNGGYCDGTLCVELRSNDTYVCHMKDGSESFHGSPWLALEDARRSPVLKEVDGVPGVQAPGIYTIDTDGNPKKDGIYDVLYAFDDETHERLFKNGEWTHLNGDATAFGHTPTKGERYIIK